MRRTLLAALLVTAALASLALGWGARAWRGARAEEDGLTAEPGRRAQEESVRRAQALSTLLAALLEREDRRPYYDYQNLFHDPRGASEGSSVTPSALAQGPGDPLVAVDFQVLPRGTVSLPTLNPDLPALDESARAVQDRIWRDRLQQISPELSAAAPQFPFPDLPLVATQAPPPPHATQTQALDVSSYLQNANANQVFQNVRQQKPALPAASASGPAIAFRQPVRISLTPLEWTTQTLGGERHLVALRSVRTPDGHRTQGFVAELHGWPVFPRRDLPAPGLRCQPLALRPSTLDWLLCIDARAEERAARTEAAARFRTFVSQSAVTLTLALLAGGLVIALVARAERVARERSHFAAAAAHELRTPLASLQLHAEMLADSLGAPERQHEYARRIAQESARLGRVVTHVLSFTQLEQGGLALPLSDVDVVPLVAETVRRFESDAIATRLPAQARSRADTEAVARILQNLVDNALRHAGAAGVEVEVAVDSGAVCIQVLDRGPGVASAVRRRLFQPFARDPGQPRGGLGLGLLLSREQARAMGGELTHADREGGGSVFTLRLLAA